MMTALKLCNSLLANARLSAAASPLASRPRSRSLVVYAAKATAPTIKQPEFIQKLAKESEKSEEDVKASLKAVLDLITEEVSSGNRVSFTGFGVFEPRERAARKGTNPQTKEIMDLPASKSPGFTAGKAFKDKVNGNGKA